MFKKGSNFLILLCSIFIISCSNSDDISYFTKKYPFYIPDQNEINEINESKKSKNFEVIDDVNAISKKMAKRENLKWINQSALIVNDAAKFAPGDKDKFVKQILWEVGQRTLSKLPIYVERPDIKEKVGKIGDSLIENIKKTDDNNKNIEMLATYLFILDDPQRYIMEEAVPVSK